MRAGYLILSIIPQDGLAGTALQDRQCRLDPEPSGQTIVKPTALGPVANTDTKLLIYGLFQMGRVLAQDGVPFDRTDGFRAPVKEFHLRPRSKNVLFVIPDAVHSGANGTLLVRAAIGFTHQVE